MYLNEHEKHILKLLAECWNSYLLLEVLHPTSNQEFMQAIHTAQNMILSRPMIKLL